jgi:hypothetical protein
MEWSLGKGMVRQDKIDDVRALPIFHYVQLMNAADAMYMPCIVGYWQFSFLNFPILCDFHFI